MEPRRLGIPIAAVLAVLVEPGDGESYATVSVFQLNQKLDRNAAFGREAEA